MISKQLSLAVMFVGIAAVAFAGVLALPNVQAETQSETSGVMGHITLILTGPDGVIKQYVQTDNLVTDKGKDCIVEKVFNADTVSCGAGDFQTIGLGTTTTSTQTSTDVSTPLIAPCIRFAAAQPVGDGGTDTQKVTITASFGGATQTGADVDSVECAKIITEAGLFNAGGESSGATGDMFSYQSFGAVTVGASDSLTVNWVIDFSG